jgi:hypothetical protein
LRGIPPMAAVHFFLHFFLPFLLRFPSSFLTHPRSRYSAKLQSRMSFVGCFHCFPFIPAYSFSPSTCGLLDRRLAHLLLCWTMDAKKPPFTKQNMILNDLGGGRTNKYLANFFCEPKNIYFLILFRISLWPNNKPTEYSKRFYKPF